MAWIFDGGSLKATYHQWKTQLLGYEIEEKDYAALAAVSDVYHKGGRLLLEHEFPKLLKFESSKPAIRPLNQVSNGALAVSEPFKTMVENFDPGVHQFVPLDVQYGKRAVEEKRYIWNIHTYQDELDWERSTTKETRGYDKIVRKKVVLRKQNVVLKSEPGEGKPHVFRLVGEPRIIAISDILKEALDKEKLLKTAPIFRANES